MAGSRNHERIFSFQLIMFVRSLRDFKLLDGAGDPKILYLGAMRHPVYVVYLIPSMDCLACIIFT